MRVERPLLLCLIQICVLHLQGVCHRDLKLENTLLDGRPAPRLKICDFGYSKSAVFDSQPKSTVGTPAYIAPEVRHPLTPNQSPECLRHLTSSFQFTQIIWQGFISR